MRLINWLMTFVVALVLMSLTACGNDSGDSYSNSTLAGTWIITETSKSYYLTANDTGRVKDFGEITEISKTNFTDSVGLYSVASDGSFSFSITGVITGMRTNGIGNLLSSTSGTISLNDTPGTLAKVTDLAICQGHYSGTISKSGLTNNISFDVDASGSINNFFSGNSTIIIRSGKAYAVGNNAIMHLNNNIGNDISVRGTLENGHFAGSFQSGSPEIGTISLDKS